MRRTIRLLAEIGGVITLGLLVFAGAKHLWNYRDPLGWAGIHLHHHAGDAAKHPVLHPVQPGPGQVVASRLSPCAPPHKPGANLLPAEPSYSSKEEAAYHVRIHGSLAVSTYIRARGGSYWGLAAPGTDGDRFDLVAAVRNIGSTVASDTAIQVRLRGLVYVPHSLRLWDRDYPRGAAITIHDPFPGPIPVGDLPPSAAAMLCLQVRYQPYLGSASSLGGASAVVVATADSKFGISRNPAHVSVIRH